MTADAARATILDAIAEVAPDVETATVADDEPLQTQLDLDSMDFLTILGRVSEEAGVDIPERDYGRLETLSGAVDYLVAATAAS